VPKLTNEQALELFTEVLKTIHKMPKGFIVLKKLKTVHGWCHAEDDYVEVDYRKEFLLTVIHEVLHYIRPDWSESAVMYCEKRIANVISSDDIVYLLKAIVKKL
jgi:hypothetical protein